MNQTFGYAGWYCRESKVRRSIKLRTDYHYEALRVALQSKQGDNGPFWYDQRVDIEDCLSQGVSGFGTRRSR